MVVALAKLVADQRRDDARKHVRREHGELSLNEVLLDRLSHASSKRCPSCGLPYFGTRLYCDPCMGEALAIL